MFTGNFKQCTPVDSKDHTMQDALEDYIYIKMYNLLKENIDNRYRKIKVVGYYNREISISIDAARSGDLGNRCLGDKI